MPQTVVFKQQQTSLQHHNKIWKSGVKAYTNKIYHDQKELIASEVEEVFAKHWSTIHQKQNGMISAAGIKSKGRPETHIPYKLTPQPQRVVKE